MQTRENSRLVTLRTRLAGKPLLGFDTSSWEGAQQPDRVGQVAFATVGDKDERGPSRQPEAKRD